MQILRGLEYQGPSPVGLGLHVLLVSDQGDGNPIAHRLAGMGGVVEQREELFGALESIIETPRDYGLLVIDCDGFGGLERGHRIIGLLGEVAGRVPVILISAECTQQVFPEDRLMPTVLRAPLSAVAMRVGFEHALRDRLVQRQISYPTLA